MSFFTRKAANAPRMETIAPNPLSPDGSEKLNKDYQTAFKTFIHYKYPQIRNVMAYINEGVRIMNKIVSKPSLNKDDKDNIKSIATSMFVKLDNVIPSEERREKYKMLHSLILNIGINYEQIVPFRKGQYTPSTAVLQEIQGNLERYQTSATTNTPVLNAREAASKAAMVTATESKKAANAAANKRFEHINVISRIVANKMNAATGMYNNSPTAGESNSEAVEAVMRNAAAKALVFPTVPSHPIKPRGGSRRRRRYTRRRRL